MSIQGTYAKFNDNNYRYGGKSRLLVLGKIRAGIRGFAEQIESRIKLSMQAPKHGRLYTSVGGKVHVASAPGEPPAVESGALLGSIGIRYRAGGMIAEIGVLSRTDPPYAHRLEVGVRMAAHPYIKPVADAIDKEFIGVIRAAIAQ